MMMVMLRFLMLLMMFAIRSKWHDRCALVANVKKRKNENVSWMCHCLHVHECASTRVKKWLIGDWYAKAPVVFGHTSG